MKSQQKQESEEKEDEERKKREETEEETSAPYNLHGDHGKRIGVVAAPSIPLFTHPPIPYVTVNLANRTESSRVTEEKESEVENAIISLGENISVWWINYRAKNRIKSKGEISRPVGRSVAIGRGLCFHL